MAEHGAADVGGDALAYPGDEIKARVSGDRHDHDHAEQRNQRRVEQRRIAARKAAVDDPAQALPQHQHAPGRHHQRHQGDRDLPAIRRDKAEDACELADVAVRRPVRNAVPQACHG